MRWTVLAVAIFALGVSAALVLALLSSDELYMSTGPTTTTDTTASTTTEETTTEESTTEETTTADTTPRPPPPQPTPDPLFAEIDRALEALRLASIAFNAPTALRKDESAVIQLLLSLKKPVRDLQAELTEIGEREGARVRVSPIVEARLTGSGFKIEAITRERQAVSSTADTEWTWEIKAMEAGSYRLHLTLSALIAVEGDRAPRAIRTFDRTIVIHVTWEERILGFVGDNVEWLWAAIIAPLAGLVLGIWRRRKGQRAA